MGKLAIEDDQAQPARQRLAGREIIGVVAMFLGTFTVGIDGFILSPLLTAMAGSFRAGVNEIALGVTAYAIAYAVGAPVLAGLGDRFRPQLVAAAGMLIFTAATIALAAQTQLAGLYIFRVIAGFGGAMWMPNVQAYVTRRWAPPLSAKLIGIIVAGLSAAIALGVPVGSFAASVFSWRQTFLGVACLGVLSAAILLCSMTWNRSAVSLAARRWRDYAAALTVPAVRWSLTTTLLWMTGFYGLYTFIGTFLQSSLHIGTAAAGTYLIAYGIGNFAASMTSGWVNTKLGSPRRAITVFGVASCVFVLLLTSASSSAAMTVMFMLGWALSQGYASTALITLAASKARKGSATVVLALNSSLIYVGTALGSAVFGLFRGSAPIALGIPSAVLTLAAIAACQLTNFAAKPAQ